MTERDWNGIMEASSAREAAARALRWARFSAWISAATLLLLIFQMLR